MEFRKETIYFILIDRFFNSCSGNDSTGREGLFDPTRRHWGRYWGGDLKGVIEKADYLQSLGVTALWLSPLFEQVDDLLHGQAPMHGYWIRDFKRLNPHFIDPDEKPSLGHSETLQQLIQTFHDRGIKLILDIVCNHSSPDVNGSKGVVYDDGVLIADFNDDQQGMYHHYGPITDWDNEFQQIHHEMMGLATFNETNMQFRNYIKSAIRAWLEIGFDALRIDTVKHMPIWFWQEFVNDIRRCYPETFVFGEYGFGSPYDPRTITYANHSGMSLLDFGLAYAIRGAFSDLSSGGFCQVQALLEMDYVYKRSTELVYAFTRRYRDSRVFTLLNQGDDTCLSIHNCDLPDGEHRCLLTGETVRIEAGTIWNLHLPARTARVLSVIGPGVEARVVVKFQLNNFFTQPGQVVVVTGDVPELGGWDLRRAPTLEFVNADTWFNEIAINESAGQAICFRFAVIWAEAADPYHGACHENVLPRRYSLPAAGRVKLEHDWESF